MRPVRRRDRQNRDLLKNLFRRKDNAALVNPNEDYLVDDLGRPIVNLLPEAEVAGTPTQYEEADLAASVLRGGALAGREALGMVPVVGEALDLAELSQIARTGKDFYGDEADPAMYAGMTAAGLLLPNIIERPARAIGRGLKKFFKFGKKNKGEFDPFTEGLDDLFEGGPAEPVVPKKPEDLFEPSVMEPYPQRTDLANTHPHADEGSEFVRRFFADPQVQDHYRNLLVGSSPSDAQVKDAINMAYRDAAEIRSRQSVLGAPERKRVDEIAETQFGGDYSKMWQESSEAKLLQSEYLKKMKEAGDVALSKVYRASLHPDYDPVKFAQSVVDEDDAVALEALFLRGQRTPNPIMNPSDDFIKGADGVYLEDLETVVLRNQSQKKASTAAHESQHFADVKFLKKANGPKNSNPNAAQKVLNGLTESVSPEYKEIVLNNQYFQPQVDFNKYLASPAEITARTREAQRYLADVLLNNPTRNAEVANLSTKERVAFLLGDFSVLSDSAFDDVFSYSFSSMQKNQGRGVINMFNNVLDGGEAVMVPTLEPHRIQTNISDKKKEAISNLFKFSLVTLGAAGSYGAMDNQGEQPPSGMAAGGIIPMLKKQDGMRPIGRKDRQNRDVLKSLIRK